MVELLSGCALGKKLDGIPVYLGDNISIEDISADDEKKDLLSELIHANFQSSILMAEIKERLEDNYNDDYISKIIDFYRTKPAAGITRMETAAFKPLFLLLVQNFDIKKLTDNRKKLINQIMQNTKIMEVIKLMLMEILHGITSCIPQLTGREIDTSEYAKHEKSMLDNISSTENQDLVFHIYAACYSGAKDGELEEYNRYLLTEHGRWFINQITEGIRQGTEKCMKNAIDDFIKATDAM